MDVNARGTTALLDSVDQYMVLHKVRKRPWMVFASSREIYGANCSVGKPCNEKSVSQPLNLYGETKWLGEQTLVKRSPVSLSGHIVLRLASVYGGLFDLPERLIPSLATRCMTNNVVELNGGNQIFDFVYIDDVVHSFSKAVVMLDSSSAPGRVVDDYLVCSGEHTSAQEVLEHIRAFTSSKSAVSVVSADTRYPNTFVCDNAKLQQGLGWNRFRKSQEGLAAYLRSMYDRNTRLLERSYKARCPIDTDHGAFDVQSLENCSVYVTAINDGPTYLKHLSYPEPTKFTRVGNGVIVRSDPNDAYFTLQYEGDPFNFISYNNSRVLFKAVFDASSGGYILQGTVSSEGPVDMILGHDLQMQLGGPSQAMAVSIWPYSCPPYPVTGKSRLPTALNDPIWYILHEIIPPESILPHLPGYSLACRRLLAAIEHARSSGADILEPGHGHLSLCDSDCNVLAGCVNTGACRCISSFCGRDLDGASRFPFKAFAFTNLTSFATLQTLSARDRIADLPYRAIFKTSAARHVIDWDPPKVYVMNVDFISLFGQPLDDSATTFLDTACFMADHFFRTAAESLNASLSEADYIFIPFYSGWLHHHRKWTSGAIANGLEELVRQARAMIEPLTEKRPRLLAALTHDYGAAIKFSEDMREFRGQALSQPPSLDDVIVMSPFGDYNTLGYIPDKDLVIPPATCRTPLLLANFRDASLVKLASEREFLVYFSGSADVRTGSAARSAILSGTLFPNSKVKLESVQNHDEYMRVLNESIFCPHVFGTTGWATCLSDAIYAGCIPVLTSDVTHPPFWDILDWSKFSVYIDWRRLEDIEEMLRSFSPAQLDEKQAWLLKVREAFLYDLDNLGHASDRQRKGPFFHAMLSLQTRRLREYT